MHGKMQMRSCAALNRHTNAIAPKARSRLNVSGIHILKLERFVFFFSYGLYL